MTHSSENFKYDTSNFKHYFFSGSVKLFSSLDKSELLLPILTDLSFFNIIGNVRKHDIVHKE